MCHLSHAALLRDVDIITSFTVPFHLTKVYRTDYSSTTGTLFIGRQGWNIMDFYRIDQIDQLTTSGILINQMEIPDDCYMDFSILEDGTLWLLGCAVFSGDIGDGSDNLVYHVDGTGNLISMFYHEQPSFDYDYGIGISASIDKNRVWIYSYCGDLYEHDFAGNLISKNHINIPCSYDCFDFDYVDTDDLFWTMNEHLNCGYAFDGSGQYIYRFVYPETLSPKPVYIAHYQGDRFWLVSDTRVYLVEMGPAYASVSDWNVYR